MMSDATDFIAGIFIAMFSILALACVVGFIGSIVGAFGMLFGAAWGSAVAGDCLALFCATGLTIAIFFSLFS